MSKEKATAKSRRQVREAINWFVANDSDENNLRRADEREWDTWCADAGNRAAYAEVVRLHQEVAALPRPTLPSPEALLEDVGRTSRAPDPPPEDGASKDEFSHRDQHRSWWGGGGPLAVLAAAAAFLALGALFQSGRPAKNVEQSYSTAPGEQRSFTLPDGSRIRLGGDTALFARFTAEARTIELERGEAFFWVQHNPRQPFVVAAAGGTTTAIGTAFEVRRYATRVEVWVQEGAVEVAPLQDVTPDASFSDEATRWSSLRVAGGEEMTYTAQGEATAPHHPDPRVTAAWSEGHLVPLIYRGRTLQEVIDEVQSYSRRRIMVDPAAADLEYTGIVSPEDVGAWIRDLPSIYPNVDVIDCRTSQQHAPGCLDADRIVIRLRLNPRQDGPESARR